MPSNISREEMEAYRQAALARQAREQEGLLQRREAALEVAQQAAKLLKEEFGATRVVIFGSLAHNAWFSQRSDIDLAAEGIPPATFWRAWAALDGLSGGLEIDLVAYEEAQGSLREAIEREGVEL